MHLFLLGDEMGVGKTLSAVLMMWARKDEPGMSIVVAPKNICGAWVDTIHYAFHEVGLAAKSTPSITWVVCEC
jgi:SNF2 family DNA or RNA helicase